jgi:hypothetical protein
MSIISGPFWNSRIVTYFMSYMMKRNFYPPMVVSRSKGSVYLFLSRRNISLLSLFIISLSCHKKILCDTSFNENETSLMSSDNNGPVGCMRTAK